MMANRLTCVLILLGGLAGPLFATGRCVIRRQSYHAPAVQKVAVKEAAVVYPYYPYSAGYNPGYELGFQRGASEERLANAINALAERIGALEQRLAGTAAPPAAPAPMPPPRDDPFAPREAQTAQEREGLATLRTHCARCHDPSRGAVKGGLILLQGGRPVALTCEEILAVSRRVYLGEMPPSGPLSPEDTGAVMALMATTEPKR